MAESPSYQMPQETAPASSFVDNARKFTLDKGDLKSIQLGPNPESRMEVSLPEHDITASPEHMEYLAPAVDTLLTNIRSHVAIPDISTNELLQRVFLVDAKTYKYVTYQETGTFAVDQSAAQCLPNRLCIVNKDRVIEIATSDEVSEQDALTAFISHEAIHSLGIIEAEKTKVTTGALSTDIKRPQIIRFGIWNAATNEETFNKTTNLLNDGAIEYIRNIAQDTVDPKLIRFKDEYKIIQRIAGLIGDQPIYEAMFQEDGLKKFEKALESVLGEGALGKISWRMFLDSKKMVRDNNGEERTDYKYTNELLENAERGIIETF